MKLNERMRFPHPVLNEVSGDYIHGTFQCGFMRSQTEKGALKITSDLNVSCDFVSDLINVGKAACGYYIVCRATYFNKLQEVQMGKANSFFDLNQLFGAVTLRPVIWSLSKLDKLESPLFHAEYGGRVSLNKGAIIAYGPEYRLSVDKERFKPFETIFSLDIDDRVETGTIKVDPFEDKIKLLADHLTHEKINSLRNTPHGRKVLLSSVFMPAVMDVVAQLQTEQSLTSMRWFRVFKAKCDDLNIDPQARGVSVIDVAQQLLRKPLEVTIKSVGDE